MQSVPNFSGGSVRIAIQRDRFGSRAGLPTYGLELTLSGRKLLLDRVDAKVRSSERFAHSGSSPPGPISAVGLMSGFRVKRSKPDFRKPLRVSGAEGVRKSWRNEPAVGRSLSMGIWDRG